MIVPVLRGYDKLERMLNSIDYEIEHIIIIDNGNKLTNLKCNFAKELSIIRMPYNTGISIPYNIGIKLTPMAKYWLLTQNDIIWISGGLRKIHERSGPDNLCIAINTNRPFACRTIGENVIQKVGLLDESFFPAPGDDFNYHKRCHYHDINEVDISDTHEQEISATIKEMIVNNEISTDVWNDNFNRSLFGPPIDSGWLLSRRRMQEPSIINNDIEVNNLMKGLDAQYIIHNTYENIAFKKGVHTI